MGFSEAAMAGEVAAAEGAADASAVGAIGSTAAANSVAMADIATSVGAEAIDASTATAAMDIAGMSSDELSQIGMTLAQGGWNPAEITALADQGMNIPDMTALAQAGWGGADASTALSSGLSVSDMTALGQAGWYGADTTAAMANGVPADVITTAAANGVGPGTQVVVDAAGTTDSFGNLIAGGDAGIGGLTPQQVLQNMGINVTDNGTLADPLANGAVTPTAATTGTGTIPTTSLGPSMSQAATDVAPATTGTTAGDSSSLGQFLSTGGSNAPVSPNGLLDFNGDVIPATTAAGSSGGSTLSQIASALGIGSSANSLASSGSSALSGANAINGLVNGAGTAASTGGALGALAGLGSAALGYTSTQNAAAAQTQAANSQLAQDQLQRNQNIQNATPYLNDGTLALNALQTGLGLNPGGNGTGSLNAPFTAAQYQASPGYDYQMQQGIQAAHNGASAAGGIGGNQLMALNAQGQGLADSNYQQAYKNYVANQLQNYNMLNGQVNTGLSATNALAGVNTTNTSQVNSALAGLGNASSAAATGTANAASAGVNSLAQFLASSSSSFSPL